MILQKPVLALHKSGDSEQLKNGIMAQDAGVAQAGNFQQLSRKMVQKFLQRVHNNDFKTVDLQTALPDTITAILETLEDVARNR